MKILDVEQIRAGDGFTIANEPISSLLLMERASKAFASVFVTRFAPDRNVLVVAGTGNNGGDGLAIARMLHEWSYRVKVFVIAGGKETSDFKDNLARLKEKIEIATLSEKSFSDFGDVLANEHTIIVDAIFGSGLSRPVDGLYAKVIEAVNESRSTKVAVDVPSGLMADKHSSGAIVKASLTITFQAPKLAFMLPENDVYTGEWVIADIGISKNFLRSAPSSLFYLTPKVIGGKIKVRRKFDNKGDYGKALIVAGSYGKMGAAVLSSRATLRAGVGLLTVHVPAAGYQIIQTAVPEAMAIVDQEEKIFSSAVDVTAFTVIGVGPGIGQDPKTVVALEKIMEAGRPMVIDADALNIISANRYLLKIIPSGSILTPHPKEFERLAGKWSDDFDRLKKQRDLATDSNVVVIVKGAYTSIAAPDGNVYFNSTGNPGMATGGSGDVLTGVLTGILAQGYSAIDAAQVGVFLHGLAGDLAATDKGMSSLIASDLVDYLPFAVKKTRPLHNI